ncbi:MAG: hypothetical protein CSYNP_00433 [Syntrophus sp. SKADARSKE-3]|nr:hypothetical protein [Syntrophus sp. SKADARSKE-3]
MSQTISAMLRKVDMFVRFGDEEFCCLLPETDLQSALILAERVQKIHPVLLCQRKNSSGPPFGGEDVS